MEPMQAPASWSGFKHVPNTFDPHNEVTERICDLGLYNENEQRFDLDFDQPIYSEFLRPEEMVTRLPKTQIASCEVAAEVDNSVSCIPSKFLFKIQNQSKNDLKTLPLTS